MKRIGLVEAAHEVPVLGREEGGGAVSAVDVEPEAAAPGELGDGLEVVVAPRGRGAGVGDRRRPGGGPSRRPRRRPRVVLGAGMEALVGGDRDRRVLAEAHDGDGPLDAVMARLRDQDGDGGFAPDALPPDVVPGRRLAGREQGGQVADRPAVREDAVGVRPEAGEAGHPADELSLHGHVHRPHLVDGRSVVQELPGEAAERGQGQRRRALVADDSGDGGGRSTGRGSRGGAPRTERRARPRSGPPRTRAWRRAPRRP